MGYLLKIIDRSPHRRSRRLRSPDGVPDNTVHSDEDLPGASPVPVLAQPNTLPGAQGHPPITDRQCQVRAKQAGLGMGGHVVRPLAGVLEGDGLRHQPEIYKISDNRYLITEIRYKMYQTLVIR